MRNKHNFVQLAAWRQHNGLRQVDVAEYLHVSRGFISLVEKGSAKLSTKKLIELFEAAGPPHYWAPHLLVPEWDRYQEVCNYIINRNEELGIDIAIPKLPEDTCKAIEYGEAAIPKTFVDDVCKAFPEINRDYVLNGAGDLILEQEGKGPSPIDTLAEKVDNLTNLLTNVSNKLDLILKSLSV